MRLIHTIAVLGGDARQRYLSELLSSAQFSVRTFGVPGLPDSAPSALEAASQADAVCLPTPAIASGAVTGLPRPHTRTASERLLPDSRCLRRRTRHVPLASAKNETRRTMTCCKIPLSRLPTPLVTAEGAHPSGAAGDADHPAGFCRCTCSPASDASERALPENSARWAPASRSPREAHKNFPDH